MVVRAQIRLIGAAELTRQLSDAARKSAEEAFGISRLRLLQKLRQRTPVQTGRTRASWRVRFTKSSLLLSITNSSPAVPRLEFGGYGSGPRTAGAAPVFGLPMRDFASKGARSGIVRRTAISFERGELKDILNKRFEINFREFGR